MCLLLGNVDNARLKVAGAVRAISRWHWKENIVVLGASIVTMSCDGEEDDFRVRGRPQWRISSKLT